MRYENAASFRAALEARLSRMAESGGQGIAYLRKQVVFERILARLAAVAPDRFVLKGALALEFRAGGVSRPLSGEASGVWDAEKGAWRSP